MRRTFLTAAVGLLILLAGCGGRQGKAFVITAT